MPEIPEGVNAVNMYIIKSDGINPPHQLTSEMSVNISEFPLQWHVNGEGVVDFLIFVNGVHVATESVDFGN